jgi:hypothetical protein
MNHHQTPLNHHNIDGSTIDQSFKSLINPQIDRQSLARTAQKIDTLYITIYHNMLV